MGLWRFLKKIGDFWLIYFNDLSKEMGDDFLEEFLEHLSKNIGF